MTLIIILLYTSFFSGTFVQISAPLESGGNENWNNASNLNNWNNLKQDHWENGHELNSSSKEIVTTLAQFCTGNRNNTMLSLNRTCQLNFTCEVSNAHNITLDGQPQLQVVIRCVDSGFKFFNVSALTISGIKFVDCGANWTLSQPQLNVEKLLSQPAMLFVGGSDLTLVNVVVLNAKSAGIYVYNVAGFVTIRSCEVNNATSDKWDTTNGNVIVYDDDVVSTGNHNTSINITNSVISNCGISNKEKLPRHENFSFSSGLILFLGTPRLTVSIINTTFTHNIGCNGGNLAVLYYKFAPVKISDCNFTFGYACFGGGAYISFQNSFLNWKYTDLSYYYNSTVLSISNSTFAGNMGRVNAGGVYFHWEESPSLNGSADVKVSNTTFDGNAVESYRSGGLAILYQTYLNPSEDPSTSNKLVVTLNISNCTFVNHNPRTPNDLQSENSVIFALNVTYLGLDRVTVKFNNCTAIEAVGSKLIFFGSNEITSNSALTGAGIRMCLGSVMYLTPYLSLIIANNSAQLTGGGIQAYGSNCRVAIPKCFYQFSRDIARNRTLLDTVNFTIANNIAEKGGDNVFGGSIDYCYLLWIHKDLTCRLNVPENTVLQPSSISSVPQQVCLCYYTHTTHGRLTCIKNSKPYDIYPGEFVMVFARVVGQFNGSISGAISANIEGGKGNKNESIQTVDMNGGYVAYTLYSTTNTVANEGITVNLHATLNSSMHDFNPRHSPAKIHVHFQECPFGFTIAEVDSSDSKYACKCKLSPSVANCSIQAPSTITKLHKSWIGEFRFNDDANHTYIAFSKYCPLDYCNSSLVNMKSNAQNLSQDEQCQYNRTGILCGSCPEGWSLVLGSSECRESCSNVWLLLIVPFALAGLLLVIVIHFLNLTVTMGTVCGLIFYANIMQDYSVALLSFRPIPGLTPILQIFLSWMNLDLGISTCFYSGMEAFGKTVLLFVFPAYIWLISIAIIVLSDRYITFTRWVGQNSVKILCTLFLLSYSKMLRVTINVLQFKEIKITYENGIVTKLRWITDGNIPYFDPHKHLILAVVAIVFILLLLPFSFSLLCIRRVYSLSNCFLFSWVHRLKPFIDAYTAPFKDNAMFWTGFLLFVRLFLLIIHTLDFHYYVVPYYFIIAVCLSLSVALTILQGVYKKHYLNVLEHFYLWNISITFLLNTYIRDEGPWKSIPSHFFVLLALLVLLGIIAYHIYLKVPNFGCKVNKIMTMWRKDAELHSITINDDNESTALISS